VSVISILHPRLKDKTKVKETTQKVVSQSRLTRSHDDFPAIIGVSGLILVVLLIVTMLVPIWTLPGPSVIQIGECRKMILGFEQKGYYTSQEQFRSAISYCYPV
jgi:hypothetical protein